MILTHHGINSCGFKSKIKDDLITLFYGDLDTNTHQFYFRYLCPEIQTVNPNVTNCNINIAETKKMVTPLGNVAVFDYFSVTPQFYCMAYPGAGSIPFGDFTTDFYAKIGGTWYGNRFIASQLRIRDVSAGNTRNLNNGPYKNGVNFGYYYNYAGSGAYDRGPFMRLEDGWAHWEFDFDFATKTLSVWINGIFCESVYIGSMTIFNNTEDYFHASRVTNDYSGFGDRIITQLGLWRKKMNGTCYSLGLYHNGKRFLV